MFRHGNGAFRDFEGCTRGIRHGEGHGVFAGCQRRVVDRGAFGADLISSFAVAQDLPVAGQGQLAADNVGCPGDPVAHCRCIRCGSNAVKGQMVIYGQLRAAVHFADGAGGIAYEQFDGVFACGVRCIGKRIVKGIGCCLHQFLAAVDFKRVAEGLLAALGLGDDGRGHTDFNNGFSHFRIQRLQGLERNVQDVAGHLRGSILAIAHKSLNAVCACGLQGIRKGILALIGSGVKLFVIQKQNKGIGIAAASADSLHSPDYFIFRLGFFRSDGDGRDLQRMQLHRDRNFFRRHAAVRVRHGDLQRVVARIRKGIGKYAAFVGFTVFADGEAVAVRLQAAIGEHGPGDILSGDRCFGVNSNRADGQFVHRHLKTLIHKGVAVIVLIQYADLHGIEARQFNHRGEGVGRFIAAISHAFAAFILQLERIAIRADALIGGCGPDNAFLNLRGGNGGGDFGYFNICAGILHHKGIRCQADAVHIAVTHGDNKIIFTGIQESIAIGRLGRIGGLLKAGAAKVDCKTILIRSTATHGIDRPGNGIAGCKRRLCV